MIVKSHDRIGTEDADTSGWHELATIRLTRLTATEQACDELQQQVERLRQEHHQLLASLHARDEALAICHEELAWMRPMGKSWAGTAWRFVQWARKPAHWAGLVSEPVMRMLKSVIRMLKSLAGNRGLRRFMGRLLRRAPGLRGRLKAMIGLS